MQNYDCEISYENILSVNSILIRKINKSGCKKTRLISIQGKTIPISNREFQCVKLLAHGKRIKEIARYLEISNRTVECYLGLLKEKIACHNHEHLVDFYWIYLEPKTIEI